MELHITTDQVDQMAPDASAAKAGKKLALEKFWSNLGHNGQAIWGECQGSSLYQVCIERSTFTTRCSCPSRKLPCKHSLGLLFLAAAVPTALPESEPLEWVSSWLSKREAQQQRQETRSSRAAQQSDADKQKKTIEKREEKIQQGLSQLDLWLNDLIRNGLGSLEAQPSSFWEGQAAQMVDAQASGLATRIRALTAIPNASKDWTSKLLAQLGKLALLSEAYQHQERLSAEMQENVRQLVGWSLKEPEVLERGTHISDDWLFLGQTREQVERGRAQRTWLYGTTSGQATFVLQFSYMGAPFGETYPLGTHQQAELVYWPGVVPQRALFAQRHGISRPIQERLPGVASFTDFLDGVARQLGRNPWQERFLCLIQDSLPIYDQESKTWWLRDQQGQSLPLARSQNEHWKLLALSGGHPLDLAAEWNGETLMPLGALINHSYHLL
ncbi:SWIM zinc finger family protein [Dictyobacter aurantiacus]|uniref:SWIM-type domain-containing protein n=1 Tax=Dictyobacter aurantiacus TaxID=1936993 RepID=A0A401ZIB0_9CHLR|nr:SWIM zinc finger family protein [Dictyobacter aurantiacus]GCE06586.1 hypothetical protein KDAU_39150 [Dictyobacter aurantiacus]